MTDPAVIATRAVATPNCRNCGEPLLGPHCYRCGQPVNGLVRHFSSILGDFLDSVLNIDARVFRTLWPLFAKPGLLSREYFAGRRVRYVSPVRLFVFLSIVTFFVAQLTLSLGNDPSILNNDDDIQNATTVADVEAARDAVLKRLAVTRGDIPNNVPATRAYVNDATAVVQARARKRIRELQTAAAKGEPAPRAQAGQQTIQFNATPWDPKTNPVRVAWLPDFANDWLNAQVARGQTNVAAMRQDPNRFKDAVLGALPSTLFVLLPIFALMLKLAYLFKRRLYMEHLIVALHSHAFLCMALLLVFALMALGDALPMLAGVTGPLEAALFAWMPLYLLLMQKRVYAQGWWMTLLKYCVLGVCYLVLLSFGVGFTIAASLVWG